MFEQTLREARKWTLWILEGVHSKKKVQQQRTGVEAHFAQSGRPPWLGRHEWEGKWGVRQSNHWDWKEWRSCRDLEIFGLLLWMKWEALDRLHKDVTGWVFQWSIFAEAKTRFSVIIKTDLPPAGWENSLLDHQPILDTGWKRSPRLLTSRECGFPWKKGDVKIPFLSWSYPLLLLRFY